MEMINEMNNKFFGLKEKKTKNNNNFILLFLLFYCPLHFFCCSFRAFSTVLSTTSWFFACCCLNMSFVSIPGPKPKTLPAVCADLVNPCMARKIPARFWRCDVFWDLREIECHSCFHTQEQRVTLTGGTSICTGYCTDEDVKEMWCMDFTKCPHLFGSV